MKEGRDKRQETGGDSDSISLPLVSRPLSPIKILFLIDKLVPAGTQMNLLKLVTHLDRSRFKPFLIALQEGGRLESEFRAAGVETLTLNTGRVYGLSGFKTWRFLVKWMRKFQPDIVQTHFLHADILGTLAAREAGVKHVITARRDEGFWRSGRQIFLNRVLNQFADRILANSEAVAQAVRFSEKIYRSKIDVIYNGVELPTSSNVIPAEAGIHESMDSRLRGNDRNSSLRHTLGVAPDEILFGMVANMRHAIKGHVYLLEGIAEAVKQNPKIKLFLAGDGPLRPDFEKFVRTLKIEKQVLFLGSRSDVPELLDAMDVGCLSSVTEGFSNSVLEYMAHGKPVIVTNVGGNPEAVTADTGFLIPPRNPGSFAEKILELVNDPQLRARMGAAARRRVENFFTVKKMAENYEGYYENLLGRGDAEMQRRGEITPSPRHRVSVSPTRIAHLIWALEPGGAERMVVTIVSWQKKNGYEPCVVCLTRKGALAAELEAQGIPVRLIEKKSGADFSIVTKLADFLKEENIDLLHTHVPTAGLWGRLAARRVRCPVVVSEHSDLSAVNAKFKWINRLLTGITHAYIAVSGDIQKKMIQAGVPEKKIFVVRNGIEVAPLINGSSCHSRGSGNPQALDPRLRGDDEDFISPRTTPCRFNEKPAGDDEDFISPRTTPCRFNEKPAGDDKTTPEIAIASENIPGKTNIGNRAVDRNKTPIIGTVGRLEARKDHSTFLKACALIKNQIPKAGFVLVGDGPLRQLLEQEAQTLGLAESVEFAGVRQNVSDYLARLDVFVLSSLTEGISISLLEAMLAGLPCVVTAVGGNPEVIQDGVTGKLVPAQNAQALAAGVVEMLDFPERASALAKAGRQMVLEKFSLEAMMNGIDSVYAEAGVRK